MKIRLNEEVIYQVSEFERKVLEDFFNALDLEDHIKKGLVWNIQSLCNNSKQNLKNQWMPLLFKRYKSIPTDDEELINLIFEQPDYRNKYQMDFEKSARERSSFKEE